MPEITICNDCFRHECNIPRLPRRRWTCPVCHRKWVRDVSGSWRSDSQGVGKVAAVKMSYPDGSEQTFLVVE